ncbi:MAG: hypothetical protein EPN69_14000 [Rhodanobacter sp.]|nr:MAG: hypothetical protein EPN71_14565 [Rhodanobacter sp.]TAL89543.1 MAG: hypothetical protein EPN69_14000 [Rhodanobacter sp.]TAM41908.1 MAG: hypothetical protein EPN58_04885 [Rhodanobacter sp.]TAN29197.1 MAG: hypothetical protein EPN32_01020 [Rhodanobacter sp.]
MPATGPLGHDDIDALIMRLRLGTDASELHGSLCGYLAGGGTLYGSAVLSALQLDGEVTAPTDRDLAVLDQLAHQSETELIDPELGFEPILPEDDRPLTERAEAMVDWCRGFLGGFGLAGAPAHANLSDEAQEILRDLGMVAASSFDFGNESEDEDALIEVHEFVRMAAVLLFTECSARDASSGGTVH